MAIKKLSPAASIKHLVQQVSALQHLRDNKKDLFETLTDREVEILGLVASGMTSPAIARKLEISHLTVQNHRSRIRSKLNLNSQIGYIKYALAYDLISF